MVQDIPAPPAKIAKHLGLSLRTIDRYAAAEQAPRAAMLALFWETRWGISMIETTAANDAARYFALARALERENFRLRAQLERLQQMADFGAANAPLFVA